MNEHARVFLALLSLAALLGLAACGGSSSVPAPSVEPDPVPENEADPRPDPHLPPPAPPQTPLWDADAYAHGRVALFGSFPSALVRHADTLFTSDADAIEAAGAFIVPLDVTGPAPTVSSGFATTHVQVSQLVDSMGNGASIANPIGFGFFLGEMVIVHDQLGFVLANAGFSNSPVLVANVLAFNPTTGQVLQAFDIANTYNSPVTLTDSAGAPVDAFVQSNGEGLSYVPIDAENGLLCVAMANISVVGFNTSWLPGTVQVFDVSLTAAQPLSNRPELGQTTRTLVTSRFNPVDVQVVMPSGTPVQPRLVVTVAGTTGFGPNGITATSDAAVEVFDAASGAGEGLFSIGQVGLLARPALGQDAEGNHVGFFPSAVTGEVYLLLLSGLYTEAVDFDELRILRGIGNGIPITAAQSGQPGGNIAGVALSPDGRTLAVAGFGNVFAVPAQPGRLFLLSLPENLVTGAQFGANFIPGSTEFGTVPGRTMGAVVMVPTGGARPDVYVNVAGAVNPADGLGSGPASVGSLMTFGLVK